MSKLRNVPAHQRSRQSMFVDITPREARDARAQYRLDRRVGDRPMVARRDAIASLMIVRHFDFATAEVAS